MAKFESSTVRLGTLANATARASQGLIEETAQEVVLRQMVNALESWWGEAKLDRAIEEEQNLRRAWLRLAEWAGVDGITAIYALTRAVDVADRAAKRPSRNLTGALDVAMAQNLLERSEARLEQVFTRAAQIRGTLMAALGRQAAEETLALPGI